MKHGFSALVFLGASFCAAPALSQQWQGTYVPDVPRRADDVDNIGNAGQFVFGVERVTGAFFDRETLEFDDAGVATEATQATTTVGLFGMSSAPSNGLPTASTLPRLALDYLVTDGFSVGGSLTYISHSADLDTVTGATETSSDQGTVSIFAVNPRVGYAYPFDETVGLWPRLGLAFSSRNFEAPNAVNAAETDDGNTTNWQLTLDAMLVLSPFEHFAILLGPYVDIGLGGSFEDATDNVVTTEGDSNLLSFGLSVAIVGYY